MAQKALKDMTRAARSCVFAPFEPLKMGHTEIASLLTQFSWQTIGNEFPEHVFGRHTQEPQGSVEVCAQDLLDLFTMQEPDIQGVAILLEKTKKRFGHVIEMLQSPMCDEALMECMPPRFEDNSKLYVAVSSFLWAWYDLQQATRECRQADLEAINLVEIENRELLAEALEVCGSRRYVDVVLARLAIVEEILADASVLSGEVPWRVKRNRDNLVFWLKYWQKNDPMIIDYMKRFLMSPKKFSQGRLLIRFKRVLRKSFANMDGLFASASSGTKIEYGKFRCTVFAHTSIHSSHAHICYHSF